MERHGRYWADEAIGAYSSEPDISSERASTDSFGKAAQKMAE